MYDIKVLFEAKSVAEATSLLSEHPEAVLIAGGSDVLIEMRGGKLAGRELVSIYGIDALRGVKLEDDGTIHIGSLTSFSALYADPIIKAHIPVLGEAANQVGGPQVRNIGTIGGNTCNGVTSADTASTLMAYDAIVELADKSGSRHLPLREFYIRAHQVDLRPGEMQTAILLPKISYEGYFGFYYKYAMRDAMDIATCACSANVRLSPDKRRFEDVRIAYGVAAPTPIRSDKAEALAKGLSVTTAHIDQIAGEAMEDIHPRSSWRAAKEFRLHIMEELVRRCLSESVKRAGGQI